MIPRFDPAFEAAFEAAQKYGAEVLARQAPIFLGGSRVNSDFVLQWPGAPGDVFRVEHLASWQTNQPWTPLATNLPAAGLNTNTTFTHTNPAWTA